MFMLPINPQTYLVHISVVVDLFACRFLTSSRSFQQESRPVDNIRDLDISRVGSCSPHSGLVPRVNVINKLIKISHHYVWMYGSINRLVQFKVFWLEWVLPIISAPMWEFHITRSLLPPEGSPARSDHCGSNQTLGEQINFPAKPFCSPANAALYDSSSSLSIGLVALSSKLQNRGLGSPAVQPILTSGSCIVLLALMSSPHIFILHLYFQSVHWPRQQATDWERMMRGERAKLFIGALS